MKTRLLVPALSLFISIFAQGASMSQQLDSYQSKKRVLVLLAASESDAKLIKQKKEMSLESSDAKDRDLIVLTETAVNGDLHRRFSVDQVFTAVLIGKDGGEKWRRTSTFDPKEVYAEIDSMPMRKDEVQTK